MDSNERLIVIGVFVALMVLAGYKYHGTQIAGPERLSLVQIFAGPDWRQPIGEGPRSLLCSDLIGQAAVRTCVDDAQ